MIIIIIFLKVNLKKLDYQIKINKSKFIYNSSNFNKVNFYND